MPWNDGSTLGVGPWDGAVDYFLELPDVAIYDGELWYVRYASGVWGINRHSNGPYEATGGSWEWRPEYQDFFKDDAFRITDEGTGLAMMFQLSSLTANRVFTAPDKSGTLALLSDIPGIPFNSIGISEITCTAGESVGDWVKITAANTVSTITDNTSPNILGVIINKQTATTCDVVTHGVASVFSGLDATKDRYYLSLTGGQIYVPPVSGYLLELGNPINSTTMVVTLARTVRRA